MDIKLFVCCHKEERVPGHPLLKPVQVGAALADRRFSGFLQDDSGENISAKNRSYCELTAQYWAWKNENADHYGFFHYRRYLYPQENARLPYRIEREAESPLLDRLGYGRFAELIKQYDVIAPVGEDMHTSVREHYAGAPYHHKKDLDLVEKILHERNPDMADAAEKYLSGSICYFGNIYIMSREQFHRYCEWLFPILEEFDRRADFTGYSPQELRVNGYLAERLFGIWLTWLRQNEDIRVLELPRVHWVSDTGSRWRQRIKNWLLPPGSGSRAKIKRWARKNRD